MVVVVAACCGSVVRILIVVCLRVRCIRDINKSHRKALYAVKVVSTFGRIIRGGSRIFERGGGHLGVTSKKGGSGRGPTLGPMA